MDQTAIYSICLSLLAFGVCHRLLGNQSLHQVFIKNGLYGRDLHKSDQPVIPESMGVVCGLVYLIATFLFIPVPFLLVTDAAEETSMERLASYLSALLSLTCMILLGFADDVLDLRWRVKLHIPTIASIPLLMVYYVTCGVTSIVTPVLLRSLLGRTIELGALYYVYMGMLAVFCTNSINILSGVNGVEVGQSVVIGASILFNDLLYIVPALNSIVDNASLSPKAVQTHLFSFYLIMPFVAVSMALYRWNRYPARVFVGDTYCYFAGMTFAVVGILGHYSKTMLLFFIPQILNFLISLPQLFRIIPCPRHRLPRFDAETGLLYPSTAEIPTEGFEKGIRGFASKLALFVFWKLGLVQLTEADKSLSADNIDASSSLGATRKRSRQKSKAIKKHVSPDRFTSKKGWFSVPDSCTHTTNMTLLNVFLVAFGPMSEKSLCRLLMAFQVSCSIGAFVVRYGLVHYAY